MLMLTMMVCRYVYTTEVNRIIIVGVYIKIEENYLIPKITKSFFSGSVVMLCVHALAICMLTRQGSRDFDGR
jgi:hypothetical protein